MENEETPSALELWRDFVIGALNMADPSQADPAFAESLRVAGTLPDREHIPEKAAYRDVKRMNRAQQVAYKRSRQRARKNKLTEE